MYEKNYVKIKNFISKYKYGTQILRVLNNLTTTLVYLTYPIFLLVLGIKRDPRFWRVIFVPGISFVLVSIFRNYINLPRPYEVLDIVPIINKDTKGKSFPSRHVFSVFIIAMTLYYISIPVGITLMIIGVMVAIIRVLGGVHFPRDVIAGALIGILCGIIGQTIGTGLFV